MRRIGKTAIWGTMNFVTTSHELTECDREPIHQIAAVQPFGALLKMESDWTIRHRSRNCAQVLGLAELPALGTPLDILFTPAAMDALRAALARLASATAVERLFGLALVRSDSLFDCAVHAVAGRIVLECEPHESDEFVNHVSLIAPILAQLGDVTRLDHLCEKAAGLARHMLGYDRVMIYRFHPDNSGEVIAEDLRYGLEPYLGLRYHAPDIPQQARELFVRNRVRVIRDVKAPPSPIDPVAGFGNRPLDMSMSMLRAHSPMHLAYLANMGVRASLAISISCQGRLWGMVACHHMTPRLPSFSLRTVAETFSQMLSLIIDQMMNDSAQQLRSQARKLQSALILNLADGTPIGANMPMVARKLRELIAHDGLTVQVAGELTSIGCAPDADEFAAIAPDLARARLSKAHATTRLADQVPAAKPFASRAAGALLVPISRQPYEYLILWRKPVTQTGTWAGDPSTSKITAPQERLSPRASFAAWQETVEGRSEAWSDEDLRIANELRVTLLEVILRISEEGLHQRRRAQEQQELLIAELNHGVRNILNLIRSLVSQSQHDAVVVEEFASMIGGRIAALASAHENITQENWFPAPIEQLFESEIEAYLMNQRHRFTLLGEPVLIAPQAYTVMALVVHELMTNSAKYGSLCDRSGSVTVELARRPNGDLAMAWRERGGPAVQPPSRRGFGSTIIERAIPFELKGEARLRFMFTGLEADFVIPARYITDAHGQPDGPENGLVNPSVNGPQNAMPIDHSDNDNQPPSKRHLSAPGDPTPFSLQTRSLRPGCLPEHMLVVEDSMIIAIDVEENLQRSGVLSIDVASSVIEALSAIGDREPDLAIVDFNLGNESSMPAIEELRRRGVPFVLATGYAELGDRTGEIGAMGIVRKPYGRVEIENVLKAYRTVRTRKSAARSQPSL